MTVQALGNTLNQMYNNAAVGNSVVMIHLFGIKFADEIRKNGYTTTEIVRAAKINDSYKTEISKGMRLAEYVTVRDKTIEI